MANEIFIIEDGGYDTSKLLYSKADVEDRLRVMQEEGDDMDSVDVFVVGKKCSIKFSPSKFTLSVPR
jgi:hypothetical protein